MGYFTSSPRPATSCATLLWSDGNCACSNPVMLRAIMGCVRPHAWSGRVLGLIPPHQDAHLPMSVIGSQMVIAHVSNCPNCEVGRVMKLESSRSMDDGCPKPGGR
jgi:hypothetical protein